MSILLRQGCQHMLNELNLDFLHVDVQNKILTIVGECGQPLLNINGIKFGTNNPTKVEINYATQLFDKFLEKHSEQLQELITEKKRFKDIEEPKKEDCLMQNPKQRNSYHHTDNNKEVTYNTKHNFIYFNKNNGSISFNSQPSRSEIIRAMEDQEFFDKSDKFFKDHKKYLNNLRRLNELKAELNKCDI